MQAKHPYTVYMLPGGQSTGLAVRVNSILFLYWCLYIYPLCLAGRTHSPEMVKMPQCEQPQYATCRCNGKATAAVSHYRAATQRGVKCSPQCVTLDTFKILRLTDRHAKQVQPRKGCPQNALLHAGRQAHLLTRPCGAYIMSTTSNCARPIAPPTHTPPPPCPPTPRLPPPPSAMQCRAVAVTAHAMRKPIPPLDPLTTRAAQRSTAQLKQLLSCLPRPQSTSSSLKPCAHCGVPHQSRRRSPWPQSAVSRGTQGRSPLLGRC